MDILDTVIGSSIEATDLVVVNGEHLEVKDVVDGEGNEIILYAFSHDNDDYQRFPIDAFLYYDLWSE